MKSLSDIFSKHGFDLSSRQLEQFQIYYDFLIEENKKYNLTAITDYEDVVVKHFLDSVYVCKFIDFNSFKNVCDIGSGAGFPLLPIKILFPHLEVYLVDALSKRVKFLEMLSARLGLDEVFPVHARAEDYGRGDMREKFDLTINRAVASVSVLSEYCLPLTKVGGDLLILKSAEYKEDLKEANFALEVLEARLEEVFDDIFYEGNKRSIIHIKKIGKTPTKYPRRAGIPVKRPL